jgi:hypothetical protein
MERETNMPNCCINKVVVTGAVEDIAHFKQTCGLDKEGKLSFDFNSLIPMPEFIKDRCRVRWLAGDALLVLGRGDLVTNPRPLEELMKSWKVSNIEALKEKIGPEAFENARQTIKAVEQGGPLDWYDWACMNWGTKWNAFDFKIIKEEPGRYECRFETAWRPPEPVYVKLAEKFPNLCFEINGWDDEGLFDFQATVRCGSFNIQYYDPNREGFQMGMDSDRLLDDAKAYGNDPERFLCVGLCEAVTSSENDDPGCKKAVVAWVRGDTKEESENFCREVIACNRSCIETLVTDWQFTVYAPGEIQFQKHAPPKALDVLPATSDDDLPF